MLILNIEADELLYRSCFACEKQCYKLTTKNGKVRDFGPNYTKKIIIAKLKQLNMEDYVLEGYKIVEPIEHVLHVIKHKLRYLQTIGNLQLWLSPSDGSNFRFDIAKTPGPNGAGYKAGRPPRPAHYRAVREYLKKQWGAEEIVGYEADDALGIYQTDNTVAVHIDKDINQIAGKHLNWVTNTRYIIEPLGSLPTKDNKGGGKAFFFHQLLTGDSTDNIPGINRIGPVTAAKLLSKGSTELEWLDIVKKEYHNIYKEKGNTVLLEIADLLYIVDSNKTRGSEYLNKLGIK